MSIAAWMAVLGIAPALMAQEPDRERFARLFWPLAITLLVADCTTKTLAVERGVGGTGP